MTTFSPTITCPHCGAALSFHSGHGNARPQPQDVSLCWYCKRMAIYVMSPLGLLLRKPTRQEVAQLVLREEFKDVLSALMESDDPFEAEERLQQSVRKRGN